MLKYVSKLAMDILPSVAATVIGAYIVNHYMVNRPAAEPTATASSVDPKKAEAKTEAKRADATPEINPATGPVEKAVADKVERKRKQPTSRLIGQPMSRAFRPSRAGTSRRRMTRRWPRRRPASVL